MAKRSWYAKQAENERLRNELMAARFSAMSERELVGELDAIDVATRAMRMGAGARESEWELLNTKTRMVRAAISARRQAVAPVAA